MSSSALLVSGGVTLIAQQTGTQASSYSLLFPAAPAALDFLRHYGALLRKHLLACASGS